MTYKLQVLYLIGYVAYCLLVWRYIKIATKKKTENVSWVSMCILWIGLGMVAGMAFPVWIGFIISCIRDFRPLRGHLPDTEYYFDRDEGDIYICNYYQTRPEGTNWIEISERAYNLHFRNR